MRRSAVLAAAAAAVALVVGSGASAGSSTAVNGHVFVRVIDFGAEDIASIRADGTEHIASPPFGNNWDPAVSPDGTKVAFLSNAGGHTDIYLMSADGSNLHELTSDTAVEEGPQWSPDGSRIGYASNFAGSNDIWVVDVSGANRTNLTPDVPRSSQANPSWSPDGKEIAYESNERGNWDLFAMNSDGTGARALTIGAPMEGAPDWSPDGTKIAFISDKSGPTQVWVLDVSSGQTKQLSDAPGFSPYFAWSPDGTKIAFSNNRDGDHEVYTMNPDGSAVTQITHNTWDDLVGDWQPLLDTAPPTAKAVAAKAQRGKTAHLPYRASDDSGQTSVEVDLIFKGETYPYDFIELSNRSSGSLPLKLPKTFKGSLSFCVRALDASANESTRSCASIKVTAPPKPKPKKHTPHP
jgi:dipeptidyl aminopeptidase/acylaminoacyl peptidase